MTSPIRPAHTPTPTETGIAKHTATTEYFLDTCPAVRSWNEVAEGWLHFEFDPTVEVPVAPGGIYFDSDRMAEDAQADYENALANANVERLRAAIRALNVIDPLVEEAAGVPARLTTHILCAGLEEILDGEGFGGREDEAWNEARAANIAAERLAWLRDQHTEGLR